MCVCGMKYNFFIFLPKSAVLRSKKIKLARDVVGLVIGGLTKRSEGMFIPQVSPLDWGEVRVSKIERRSSPAVVRIVWAKRWVVVPPGIAKDRREREVGRWIQEIVKQSLTWTKTSAGVDWLTCIVEAYLGRTGSEITNLRIEF